ncbi:hypothetical protein [Bacteroides pyogenes]|uniref:Uncharacterized protein n=2 Tax=Bacteroides pyogenes TaxID=310300 RepID=W4PGU4_9BACE|nr:hypothetical protein JCM6294_1869 [Bacteroides pyogenes DSM 20611 = JCM 6294]
MNWLSSDNMLRLCGIALFLFSTCCRNLPAQPVPVEDARIPDSVTPSQAPTAENASESSPCTADTIKPCQAPLAEITCDSAVFDADRVMQKSPKHHKYDRRVHRFRRKWEQLIPTHSKVQFAGNMGLLSYGMGWDYGKRSQWETDLLLGFIPKYSSKRPKLTMTLKQNYMPWSVGLGERFSAEPLACGLYMNTVFGHEFWVREPERYPKGYYGFSSKIRFHIFVGQRLTYDIDPQWRFMAKSVTFFYEISTCDLYLVSAATNSYLRPRDYLSLSFGLKFQWL